jgi:hypothetical protein
MQTGDRWHCTNPGCRAEFCVGSGPQLEVDHVYCACGAVMKKPYTPPVFQYLDFLGDRKVGTFISPAVEPVIENTGKDWR